MKKENDYFVYIMSSFNKTIYIGVTNDLARRVDEHKLKIKPGFTNKYNCIKLVYYEHFDSIEDAIRREKQIKKWRREKKNWLIESHNPDWLDLSLV